MVSEASSEAAVIAKYGQRWYRMWLMFLGWSVMIGGQGSSALFMITLTGLWIFYTSYIPVPMQAAYGTGDREAAMADFLSVVSSLDWESCRAALERHFQRHLPASRIKRAKWLGRTRADGIAGIVIDDMVVIDVARGFAPESAARALARLSDVGRTWRAKPMILAIFEAPREAVFQSAATASLIELHDRYPMLTVRMPTDPGPTEASAQRSPADA